MSKTSEGVQRQMADEVKVAEMAVREKILREAGITPEVPFGEGLALKATLALPWRKLRELRR